MQKSKDALKDFFENVNITIWASARDFVTGTIREQERLICTGLQQHNKVLMMIKTPKCQNMLDAQAWAFIRGVCHRYHNLFHMTQLICFQR